MVTIKQDKTELVGKPAKVQQTKNPELTFYDAKRLIGRLLNDENIQKDKNFWPFTLEEDEKGMPVYKWVDKKTKKVETYKPEHVSALVLKKLKEAAQDKLGDLGVVKKCVITMPAYFNNT